MALDSSAVGVERRWLFRVLATSDDQALLRSIEVFPTELHDGDGITVGRAICRRVPPMRRPPPKESGPDGPDLGSESRTDR